MNYNLTESQLVKAWQQIAGSRGLVTEAGEPIEIIYPGMVNDGRGADFRDAVMATRRGLVKGDVEVHVKSADWRAHQHHRDASYNRVILHVVMWRNTGTVTTELQNGDRVPILALQKYLPVTSCPDSVGLPGPGNTPCGQSAGRLAGSVADGFLDQAGEERFLGWAERFRRDLTEIEAGPSLYQGLMGALGYARNQPAFLELARGLPLRVLESLAQDSISDEECLLRYQALLLGAAGLLSGPRRNNYYEDKLGVPEIDRLAEYWSAGGYPEVMSASAWQWFKVRPNNSPLRRLVAMSYLLLRYRETGLLRGLVTLVAEASLSGGYHSLERGLAVDAAGYRASHSDSGSVRQLSRPALLGKERAAEIAVNVLLPFTFAWSRFTARSELTEKAIGLYHHYPRLAANAVVRHMMLQLGLDSSLVNSARRQQGLIHIYKNLCTQGRCDSCGLSQLQSRHHVQVQAVGLTRLEAEVAAGGNHGGVIRA